MKKSQAIATILIAACAVSTGAWGQNVYRCGTTYSQIPCNGAVTVKVDDTRSPQQKIQTDKAIARDMANANALDKARLKEEAQAQKPSPSGTKSSKAKTPKSRTKPKSGNQLIDSKVPTASDKAKQTKGKKKKDAEFFTAKVAAEEKKEKRKPAK